MQAGMTHQPRRDAKDYKKSRKELDFAAGIEGVSRFDISYIQRPIFTPDRARDENC